MATRFMGELVEYIIELAMNRVRWTAGTLERTERETREGVKRETGDEEVAQRRGDEMFGYLDGQSRGTGERIKTEFGVDDDDPVPEKRQRLMKGADREYKQREVTARDLVQHRTREHGAQWSYEEHRCLMGFNMYPNEHIHIKKRFRKHGDLI